MPDTHEVDVCVAVGVADGSVLIDSNTGRLPSSPLPRGDSPDDVAGRVLEGATGLVNGHWICLRQVGAFVRDRLVILYVGELPDTVWLPEGYMWTPLRRVEDASTHDLFLHAWGMKR